MITGSSLVNWPLNSLPGKPVNWRIYWIHMLKLVGILEGINRAMVSNAFTMFFEALVDPIPNTEPHTASTSWTKAWARCKKASHVWSQQILGWLAKCIARPVYVIGLLEIKQPKNSVKWNPERSDTVLFLSYFINRPCFTWRIISSELSLIGLEGLPPLNRWIYVLPLPSQSSCSWMPMVCATMFHWGRKCL